MRIDLAYGSESRSLIVPSGVDVDYITPREISGFENTAEELDRACSQAVDAPSLREVIRPGAKIALLVSDLTRGGGTKEILPPLVEYLDALGVQHSQLSVLIARGAHRKLSKEEKKFFKTGPLQGITVQEHDCDDAAKLSALLLTKRGTPVRVNRLLKESDLVILLSAISFHYFAGFGGGRKLILPGCADRAGMVANHRLSLQDTKPVKLHPECRPANLEKNPVHEDMCEALAALGKDVYALNFFCDASGTLVYLNAGDAVESHLAACEVYCDVHRVQSDRSSAILILSCGGYPYDMNLLQAHKALHHGASIVNHDGAILFFAQCGEGVGSESLANALLKPRDEFLKTAYTDYDLNNQAGVSLLNLSDKFRITMVTDLDDATLDNAGITRCTNTEACVADALDQHGANRISVIPFGSRTLPFV